METISQPLSYLRMEISLSPSSSATVVPDTSIALSSRQSTASAASSASSTVSSATAALSSAAASALAAREYQASSSPRLRRRMCHHEENTESLDRIERMEKIRQRPRPKSRPPPRLDPWRQEQVLIKRQRKQSQKRRMKNQQRGDSARLPILTFAATLLSLTFLRAEELGLARVASVETLLPRDGRAANEGKGTSAHGNLRRVSASETSPRGDFGRLITLRGRGDRGGVVGGEHEPSTNELLPPRLSSIDESSHSSDGSSSESAVEMDVDESIVAPYVDYKDGEVTFIPSSHRSRRLYTNRWYVDWVSSKCIKDCEEVDPSATYTGGTEINPHCGGPAPPHQYLFQSAKMCCELTLPWQSMELCTRLGNPMSGVNEALEEMYPPNDGTTQGRDEMEGTIPISGDGGDSFGNVDVSWGSGANAGGVGSWGSGANAQGTGSWDSGANAQGTGSWSDGADAGGDGSWGDGADAGGDGSWGDGAGTGGDGSWGDGAGTGGNGSWGDGADAGGDGSWGDGVGSGEGGTEDWDSDVEMAPPAPIDVDVVVESEEEEQQVEKPPPLPKPSAPEESTEPKPLPHTRPPPDDSTTTDATPADSYSKPPPHEKPANIIVGSVLGGGAVQPVNPASMDPIVQAGPMCRRSGMTCYSEADHFACCTFCSGGICT